MGKVAKLRDKAAKLKAKGKSEKALECYEKLSALEPREGKWWHRAGEIHRELDETEEALDAWGQAIELYAAQGFLAKAIAVCHMTLRLSPESTGIKDKVAQLVKAQQTQKRQSTPAPERVEQVKKVAKTLAPGAAIDSIPLADVSEFVDGTSDYVEHGNEIDPAQLGGPKRTTVVPLAEPEVAAEGTKKIRRTMIPIDEVSLDDAEDSGIYIGNVGADDQEPSFETSVALARTPLFSDLPLEALSHVVDLVEVEQVAKDAVIFRQGDVGDSLYVVIDGRVGVFAEKPKVTKLGELHDGSFFGEIALFSSDPRSATVRALEETSLLKLSREATVEILRNHPTALDVFLTFLRDRLVEKLVETHPLFTGIAANDAQTLAGKFQFLEVHADGLCTEQGKPSTGLYALLTGEVAVERDGKLLCHLHRGQLFGEMSLLTKEPAIATVRATRKCLALRLPANDFYKAVMTLPQMLEVVGDLADSRRAQANAVVAGKARLDEGALDLP